MITISDNKKISLKQAHFIVYVLLAFYPLVGMGIDLITPSLPAISTSLNVTSVFSKNLVSIYLLGYTIGNVLIGFLSDAFGRQKFMFVGLVIFTLSSLLPPIFPHPIILLLVRFLQGFTMAFFGVLIRAILTDVLPKDKVVRMATLVTTTWGIGPIIGPVIGGYLQFHFGWQSNFYFFALLGFISLVVITSLLPETHFNRQPLKIAQIRSNFREIITHKTFIGLITTMGLVYSMIIVFNTLGPFIIQKQMGYSSIIFGHIALWMGIAFLSATLICRFLLKYFSAETLLKALIPIYTIISFIFLALTLHYHNSLLMIAISSFVMFSASGLIYPAAMGKSISLFSHIAGSAVAVMNFVNISITVIVALLTSVIHVKSAVPLNLAYVLLMLSCVIVYSVFISKKQP